MHFIIIVFVLLIDSINIKYHTRGTGVYAEIYIYITCGAFDSPTHHGILLNNVESWHLHIIKSQKMHKYSNIGGSS